jgi:hypothetical protein|tara:strand:- start:574 stop:978 length:405 start_codon:yes stop_codon:yes gene_type:complete
MENKSGFIRIIEVATMILIITGLLLVVLNNSSSKNENSKEIYELEQTVLKKIQLNKSIRNDILAKAIGEEFDLTGIYEDRLNNFECKSIVCALIGDCLLGQTIEKDIYSQEAIISADLITYGPRKLKMFCWRKV